MKAAALPAQMRECDRIAIEELGIPGIVLMESAARGAAKRARALLGGEVRSKSVAVVCGKGNNGGDGFAAARYLLGWGAEVKLFLLGRLDELHSDAKVNADIYRRLGGSICECPETRDLKHLKRTNCDLILDAILGTGASGELKGLFTEAIRILNASAVPILAIDIPSGVDGATGATRSIAVQANETVTFGLLKTGLLFPPGREHCGAVSVVDIGIPPAVVDRVGVDQYIIEPADVRAALPKRSPAAHKGDAGYVYILAGSPGLTGAAALAAESAMRCGAGLVIVGTPAGLNPILEAKLTEAMTEPLPETADGCLSPQAWTQIEKRLDWADAIAVGPGLGRDPQTAQLILRLLKNVQKPLIIDADGLYHLGADKEKFNLPSNCVLTPHPGELSRLIGLSIPEIAADRMGIARKTAAEWRVVLHLKGAPSLTAAPDGRVIINSTGNAGMATGGSGDVLTGVIAALMAMGLNSFDAAWCGAYLHSRAGDLAAVKKGQFGMLAGDIINCLPETLIELSY
ncbi:MAG: NAD(P)H-hydrate dehydratase [Calditrichaeota bacterium]|nr:NAD(P)H-hydrate dehydratase [Calditrichota bacterium]